MSGIKKEDLKVHSFFKTGSLNKEEMLDSAKNLHMLYDCFVKAGFSKKEAMEILISMLSLHLK